MKKLDQAFPTTVFDQTQLSASLSWQFVYTNRNTSVKPSSGVQIYSGIWGRAIRLEKDVKNTSKHQTILQFLAGVSLPLRRSCPFDRGKMSSPLSSISSLLSSVSPNFKVLFLVDRSRPPWMVIKQIAPIVRAVTVALLERLVFTEVRVIAWRALALSGIWLSLVVVPGSESTSYCEQSSQTHCGQVQSPNNISAAAPTSTLFGPIFVALLETTNNLSSSPH